MNAITAPQIFTKTADEVVNVQAAFGPYLARDTSFEIDELLNADPPTVVEGSYSGGQWTEGGSDLTITDKLIAPDARVVGGKLQPAYTVATCRVAGGTSGTSYGIKITAETDGGQTRELICRIDVL